MISIHDWRMKHEATGDPVTTDTNVEPNEEDFSFYHTKIQGKAKQYLNWFLDEIEGKNISLVRKGFIVQEVMNALGMNLSQYVRVTSNIKRAMQKRDRMQPGQPGEPAPNPNAAAAVPQEPAMAPNRGNTNANTATPTAPNTASNGMYNPPPSTNPNQPFPRPMPKKPGMMASPPMR